MIYLAADHRGFELKEKIKEWLKEWNLEFKDCGAFEMNPEDDYPDFVSKAAEKVSADPENSRAIILGASGQGEAMVANRFKGVRAAVFYGGPMEIIMKSREHNNANVLSLGASYIGDEVMVKEAINIWLNTPFSNGANHSRRIAKF